VLFRRRRGLCCSDRTKGPCSRNRCASPTRMGSDARTNVRTGPPKRMKRSTGREGRFSATSTATEGFGVVERKKLLGAILRMGFGPDLGFWFEGREARLFFLSPTDGRSRSRCRWNLFAAAFEVDHENWEFPATAPPRLVAGSGKHRPNSPLRLSASFRRLQG
jgi:hypothetical protein